jgi:hypothetical protein
MNALLHRAALLATGLSCLVNGWAAPAAGKSFLLSPPELAVSQSVMLQDLDGDGFPELGLLVGDRLDLYQFRQPGCRSRALPPGTIWLAGVPAVSGARLFAFDGHRVLQTLASAEPAVAWTPAFTNELRPQSGWQHSSPVWQRFVHQLAGGELLAVVPDEQGQAHIWSTAAGERVIPLAHETRVQEVPPQIGLFPFPSRRAAQAVVLGDFAAAGVRLIGSSPAGAEMLLAHDMRRCFLVNAHETASAANGPREFWKRVIPSGELVISATDRTIDICEQGTTRFQSLLDNVAGGELERCQISRAVFDLQGRLLAQYTNIPVRGAWTWKLADVDGNGVNDLTLLNILMYQYGDKDALTRFVADHSVVVEAVTRLESWPPGQPAESLGARLEVAVGPNTMLHLRAISAAVAQRVCFGDFNGDGKRELAYVAKPDCVKVLKQAGRRYVELCSLRTKVAPVALQTVRLGPSGREALVCRGQDSIEIHECP